MIPLLSNHFVLLSLSLSLSPSFQTQISFNSRRVHMLDSSSLAQDSQSATHRI